MKNRSTLFQIIFLSNIFFTILSSWLNDAPGGWKMFAQIKSFDLSLYDKNNKLIEVYNYLPKPTYIIDKNHFFRIASHICKINKDDRPFRIEDNITKNKFEAKGCEF